MASLYKTGFRWLEDATPLYTASHAESFVQICLLAAAGQSRFLEEI